MNSTIELKRKVNASNQRYQSIERKKPHRGGARGGEIEIMQKNPRRDPTVPQRLDDRVLQPTTKYYVAIPTLSAPYTWFLALVGQTHRFSGSSECLDQMFTHRGAHGDHTHVDRVRVVGKKAEIRNMAHKGRKAVLVISRPA